VDNWHSSSSSGDEHLGERTIGFLDARPNSVVQKRLSFTFDFVTSGFLSPTIGRQPCDIDTAVARIEASAKSLRLAVEKAPGPGRTKSFAQRIRAVVRSRVPRNTAAFAQSAPEEQTFAQKVKEAAQRKSGRRQQEKAAEAQRNRYARRLRRRPHTPSG
jgi:hypothetical protein